MEESGEAGEQRLRECFERGDHRALAELIFEQHGPEIMRFLLERLRNDAEAGDVFSQFSEDVWRGLPGFQWRCSMRAWLYTLARNAANRYARGPGHRRRQMISLSSAATVLDVVDQNRSATLPYQQTAVKNRVRELRASLSDDDQLLLTLRIDKQMSWNDIALIFGAPSDVDDEARLVVASGRMRQRFQKVKSRLRVLARRHGLVS